jgi:hypothetical protein
MKLILKFCTKIRVCTQQKFDSLVEKEKEIGGREREKEIEGDRGRERENKKRLNHVSKLFNFLSVLPSTVRRRPLSVSLSLSRVHVEMLLIMKT